MMRENFNRTFTLYFFFKLLICNGLTYLERKKCVKMGEANVKYDYTYSELNPTKPKKNIPHANECEKKKKQTHFHSKSFLFLFHM